MSHFSGKKCVLWAVKYGSWDITVGVFAEFSYRDLHVNTLIIFSHSQHTSMTNTNSCEYSIKTPDDRQ